jgi:hypothetical protein
VVGKGLRNILERYEEVIGVVESLKRGDQVYVRWHDACRVTNDPDVLPEYYSTSKETTGPLYDVLPDNTDPSSFYLIILGEATGGKPDYYDAIPLGWILTIQKLQAAVPGNLPPTVTKVAKKTGKIRSRKGSVMKGPL